MSVSVSLSSGVNFQELRDGTWIDSTKYGWYYPNGMTKSDFTKPTILIGEISMDYRYNSIQYFLTFQQRWQRAFTATWGWDYLTDGNAEKLKKAMGLNNNLLSIGSTDTYFYFSFSNLPVSGIHSINDYFSFAIF